MEQPMVKTKPNLIDLDKVIKGKSPKLYKILPGFIISYLKRLVHQEDLNTILTKYSDKYNMDFAEATIKDFFRVTYEVIGGEKLDPNKRYVLASNHTIGSMDGMTLLLAFSEILGNNIKTVVNDLLMNIVNLEDVLIGVNKHGLSTKENIKQFDDAFASDTQIIVYPAGLVSRKQNGQVRDLEWKKTFLTKAIKHKREVVPVFFSGQLSNFFYNLSNIRKFLHIKTNIEMLFLADETFKQYDKHYKIFVGNPIPPKIFDTTHSQVEWAELLKNHVYKLSENHKASFEY